jgi:hypothetical protein
VERPPSSLRKSPHLRTAVQPRRLLHRLDRRSTPFFGVNYVSQSRTAPYLARDPKQLLS